jgi:hypothetical protein
VTPKVRWRSVRIAAAADPRESVKFVYFQRYLSIAHSNPRAELYRPDLGDWQTVVGDNVAAAALGDPVMMGPHRRAVFELACAGSRFGVFITELGNEDFAGVFASVGAGSG